MRTSRKVGLTAIVAAALIAIVGVGSASAASTTLEIEGITKNESVALEASLEYGTDTTFQLTSGAYINTCTGSEIQVATESPYSGPGPVGGKVSTLNFSPWCYYAIEVISPGTLTIENIPTTTNGTVVSSGAKWEFKSGLGLICNTGEGTDLGILTWGAPGGHATLDVNTVVNCGFSVVVKGTYTITSPTGLGVSA